ncbi:MAG: hypothetical protein HY290_20530, partial [Planctomycetia bacterium]|nr:hypothetical protein [Planctomycetia bacterium]
MSIQRLILTIILLCGSSRWLVAGELTARDLATPEMAVLIEVARPVQLIDNPLSRDVWGLVHDAPGINEALTTPEIDKFRHVAKFIEKSLGGDWQTGISRLTAGGIIVVVQPPKPPAEPDVTVVVTAADEQSLRQFMDAVQAEIRRASGAGKGPEAELASYRSFAVHRVGNGSYTIAGRQLVVSNTKAGLESALDRLAGAGAPRQFELPPSLRLVDQAGNAPAILATVNLKLLRQDPKTSEALKFPANDPIPVFLLGGYLDLLRRADYAALGLFVDGPSHELKIRVPVGTDGAYAGLRGYFASEPNESAPPLLKPPGAIYSAGWFRDYKKLWDARRDLFNADLVQQIEMADAKARSQPTGFGISDVLQWIGPQFRIVAARQREQVYTKKVDERLPALAFVIGVRDEVAVRDRILAPVDGLLLVALNKNIEDYKKVEYRDARITTFRFSDAAAGADPN